MRGNNLSFPQQAFTLMASLCLDVNDSLPITDFFPFGTFSILRTFHRLANSLTILLANLRLQCNSSEPDAFNCHTQHPPNAAFPACSIVQSFPARNENYSRLSIDTNPLYSFPSTTERACYILTTILLKGTQHRVHAGRGSVPGVSINKPIIQHGRYYSVVSVRHRAMHWIIHQPLRQQRRGKRM